MLNKAKSTNFFLNYERKSEHQLIVILSDNLKEKPVFVWRETAQKSILFTKFICARIEINLAFSFFFPFLSLSPKVSLLYKSQKGQIYFFMQIEFLILLVVNHVKNLFIGPSHLQ